MEKKELTTEEWKQQKREKKAKFQAMQNLPYEVKVKRAELRAWEFYNKMQKRGLDCHVSVGGLDSITLLGFLRHIGIDVPAIYGEIRRKPDGTLYTTGAQRTGCSMCGFGIHLEKRPHRFDRLRESNPKEWEFWMYRCCTNPDTGKKYGWGRVLDYIGVGWEDGLEVQMSIFDMEGMS